MSKIQCACYKSKKEPHLLCPHKALKGSKYCGIHRNCQVTVMSSMKDPNEIDIDLGAGFKFKTKFIKHEITHQDWTLGQTIDWNKVEKPDTILLKGKDPFIFSFVEDESDPDPKIYQKIKIQGPITVRKLVDTFNDFYLNENLESIMARQMPVGLHKMAPFVYELDVE
jgi:hypothetical protein